MGSEAFFVQLEEFTRRYTVKHLGHALDVRHGESIIRQPWQGAVLHYTADEDLNRVLRWFERSESKVSAHVVVHDRKVKDHDELAENLPLVQALDTTVLQCRRPNQIAWHARGANSWAYGVECVSAGVLKKNSSGQLCTWRPRDEEAEPWTTPWQNPHKQVAQLYKDFWVAYPIAQSRAVVTVLRYLDGLGVDAADLYPQWIVGHEHLQRGKLDPGPAFPITTVRAMIFDLAPDLDLVMGETSLQADPLWGKWWRDDVVARSIPVLCDSRKHGKIQMSSSPIPAGWQAAWREWSQMARPDNMSPVREFTRRQLGWFKLGLLLLGYYVTGFHEGDFSVWNFGGRDRDTLHLFQQREGLEKTDVPGVPEAICLNDWLVRQFKRGG